MKKQIDECDSKIRELKGELADCTSKNDMKKIVENHFELTFPFYYLIDVIAITKKEQKKGAGTFLLKKIFSITGTDLPIYSVAWKDKYGINIEKLYKKHKINPRINLGKVWAHGCNHKFKCPSFNKRCQCEGILFKLSLC